MQQQFPATVHTPERGFDEEFCGK